MDFYDKEEYSMEDINYLILNKIEENIHLDYKAAGVLEKTDKKRAEVTKDVSAFANSDGGIIIYGIVEEEFKPKEVSFIDGNVYTKEWLESVIQLIQPRIEGIRIIPVRGNGDVNHSIYIVKIPRSDAVPHMAKDHKYYKRFNFMSVPMEDYEVKDLYNRVSTPKLRIVGCWLQKTTEDENYTEYELCAKIFNYGRKVCELYKLNFYINNGRYCNISYKPLERKNSYTIINENRLKLSSPSQEAIYPDEQLDLGYFNIKIKNEEKTLFFEKLVVDMILFYSSGNDRLAYIPSEDKYIEDVDEIDTLLKQIGSL